MTVDIRVAQNDDAKEWDAVNSKSQHGTIFHQWDCLKIIEKHTNTTLYPLIGMKGSNSIGIIPLFFQKKGPIRMVFSPPPHAALFYLGPVMAEYDTLKQEKREIIYLDFQHSIEHFIIHELRAQYILISLSPGIQDPRPFTWSGYSFEPQYDYVIDLTLNRDALFQNLGKKQRQNVSRAKKRGITMELGGRKEYEEILDLMDIRYAQQGKIVPPSREYLLDIYDLYEDNMKIFVGKVNNETITGSIDFQYNSTHYSWIGSPKPKGTITPSPNDLLIWESVCYAQETGMKYYITMNAAGNKRLHSYFASKFNPALKVHFSLKKHSYLTGILEKVYTNITKPLDGIVKNINFEE
jgi:hypothetical protein